MRSFNSAAQADLRNGRTAEEAGFVDFQLYGDSNGLNVAVSSVTLTNGSGTVNTGLSSNVSMEVATEAAAGVGGGSYLIFTKHAQGDRVYGGDSDATPLFWGQSVPATVLQLSGVASVPNADDLGGGAVTHPDATTAFVAM
jgi:hypothetical protein